MPKLITPVQYEPSVDELNEIVPLYMGDEVQQAINLSVLNANPVSENRPVIGKLARCNQYGGLLKYNDKRSFDNYELIAVDIPERNYVLYEFAQKVEIVLWTFTSGAKESLLDWCSSGGIYTFKNLSLTGSTWLEFIGTKLYLRGDSGISGYIRGELRGFY